MDAMLVCCIMHACMHACMQLLMERHVAHPRVIPRLMAWLFAAIPKDIGSPSKIKKMACAGKVNPRHQTRHLFNGHSTGIGFSGNHNEDKSGKLSVCD